MQQFCGNCDPDSSEDADQEEEESLYFANREYPTITIKY